MLSFISRMVRSPFLISGERLQAMVFLLYTPIRSYDWGEKIFNTLAQCGSGFGENPRRRDPLGTELATLIADPFL